MTSTAQLHQALYLKLTLDALTDDSRHRQRVEPWQGGG